MAVPAPQIPRSQDIGGNGSNLTYVVMGDSTAIGQGAEYKDSYATKSAQHLSKSYSVRLINTGISGAKVEDVLKNQIPQALAARPDLVLLGVGANDTTHFTHLKKLRRSLEQIISSLKEANPDVIIVLTRSPALDSVSRFPFVSKHIMKIQTKRVNMTFDAVIRQNQLTPVFIAEKTRAAFLADPSLTAKDNFHPNARGYALWIPIINQALDQSLKSL